MNLFSLFKVFLLAEFYIYLRFLINIKGVFVICINERATNKNLI